MINVHKLLWFFDTWKEICLTISKKKGINHFSFSCIEKIFGLDINEIYKSISLFIKSLASYVAFDIWIEKYL